ncbi:YiaA/YiaB family inner membrane protein [Streptomyces cyaneofuscatus]|uniref:YiaA/YiaB family inner membrane protein n=1 Tax=Streptomyces cyaneofuscatus TaxID=66883 RepID=UPI003659AF9A
MSDTTSVKQQSTAAFYGQAVASFLVAMGAVALGIFFLDADAWVRGFLAIGVLYLVTSCFTLAKVIRDRQEAGQIVSRVDQARLEKILAEHDPFRKSESAPPVRRP